MDQTLELIKGFEGYRSKAYWDVNHWRVGYGSDTTTDEDGTVHKVTKGTVTTRDAADRDLARRVPLVQKSIVSQVGQDAWDKLNGEAQSAVTSLGYNYGGIGKLPSLKKAIKTGDSAVISKAILARADDNSGVNNDRRTKEAALVAGHPIPPAGIGGVAVAAGQNVAAGAVPPPLPRKRPDPAAAAVKNPLPAPAPLNDKVRVVSVTPAGKVIEEPKTILGGASNAGGGTGLEKPGATILTSSGRKLPNPTARDAQAEQVQGRNAGKAAAKAAKPIIQAQNRSTEQVARDEQNAILTGYRAVQEGKFPAAPNAPKPATLQPNPTKQPSGAQKAVTETVRPDGSTKPVQPAASVAMPADARPGGTTKNVSGSPDDRQKPKAATKTVTYEQPNPDYAQWEKLYGTGGANSALMDVHDKRDNSTVAAMKSAGIASKFASIGSGVSTASIPKAPPRTIAVTKTYQVADAHAAAAARVAAAKSAAETTAANRAAALSRAQAQAAASSMPGAGSTIMTQNNGAQVVGSRLNGSPKGYTVTNDNWFNSVRGL